MSDKTSKINPLRIFLITAAAAVILAVIILIAGRTRNVKVHFFCSDFSTVYPNTVETFHH